MAKAGERVAKPRQLSFPQRCILLDIADGEWHRIPATYAGSSVRGLMSRGLVEHRYHSDHPWTWITSGDIRLKPTTKK